MCTLTSRHSTEALQTNQQGSVMTQSCIPGSSATHCDDGFQLLNSHSSLLYLLLLSKIPFTLSFPLYFLTSCLLPSYQIPLHRLISLSPSFNSLLFKSLIPSLSPQPFFSFLCFEVSLETQQLMLLYLKWVD